MLLDNDICEVYRMVPETSSHIPFLYIKPGTRACKLARPRHSEFLYFVLLLLHNTNPAIQLLFTAPSYLPARQRLAGNASNVILGLSFLGASRSLKCCSADEHDRQPQHLRFLPGGRSEGNTHSFLPFFTPLIPSQCRILALVIRLRYGRWFFTMSLRK